MDKRIAAGAPELCLFKPGLLKAFRLKPGPSNPRLSKRGPSKPGPSTLAHRLWPVTGQSHTLLREFPRPPPPGARDPARRPAAPPFARLTPRGQGVYAYGHGPGQGPRRAGAAGQVRRHLPGGAGKACFTRKCGSFGTLALPQAPHIRALINRPSRALSTIPPHEQSEGERRLGRKPENSAEQKSNNSLSCRLSLAVQSPPELLQPQDLRRRRHHRPRPAAPDHCFSGCSLTLNGALRAPFSCLHVTSAAGPGHALTGRCRSLRRRGWLAGLCLVRQDNKAPLRAPRGPGKSCLPRMSGRRLARVFSHIPPGAERMELICRRARSRGADERTRTSTPCGAGT